MFSKNCGTKDGHLGICKECLSTKYNKTCVICKKEFNTNFQRVICCSEQCKKIHLENWRKINKVDISIKAKNKHMENKTERNNMSRKYYHNNKDIISKKAKEKQSQKIWRDKHKDEKRIYDKQYREKNKVALAEYQKKYHQTERGKQANKAGLGKRRARKLGAPITEKIDYNMINERDGFKCCICHKKVDMELKYPDPMSKSHDHIVPLSKGGEDANRNIQLTHLRCNVSKNNNISQGVQMHLL